ncbi:MULTISPECIES: hypothetical protein [unclassified Wolbachia]|uniref:hypothetical protein n=1 Tax=unclassified Wolbachia TaxID=2640676 RepID=UPI0011071260|nr:MULTISPECIES: hypothetical protein [unclassified Wolbachia]QVU16164.1 hypothetical protein wYak_10260 [Wolbachia endosymbiont of Drosophila yakuba]QVU17335.1 hypothetical protein wSan_11020 [Wolbachia endosymbiont of Drosophila santomea]QWE32169.1 hypothetical protein wTei_03070 [Wolbachia endosymbiont of Drosophila simulans]TLW82693.1 hypothetical protein FFT12_06070 [Wolbachia endosymbiont of Drosophila teissieri]TLW83081.1 hypothetical protein FFT13_04405 [Wolbachia endosymbiont of Droso
MTQKLILSIVLQDIIKNKEGMPASGYWMYFYDKRSPTTLRNAYYKNQEGNVVPAPNPLQLDENGALPHKLYYFVDVDDPEDRYTVELKCNYGNAAAPELIFHDLPYFQEQSKADPATSILSDNLFIDGQFNIGLQINDRGQGSGYVSPEFSQVPIAGLSWQFLRSHADSVPIQDRTDVDRIFIKDITEAERIDEGNPRFYLNVICEKPSETTPPLQKAVTFRSSNVLWGTDARAWLKFYAWRGGDDIVVNLLAIRDFGSKSSTPPQVMSIDQFLIDSDTPKVYYTSLSLLGFVIPADIGDDQSLTLKFLLPPNRAFNFKATNFYCAEASLPIHAVDFKYPTQNSDLAKSNLLFSSFRANKYSIDNSYNELVFTIDGLKFVDNIGEIVSYPKGAKVDEEKINLLKCDGRTLDSTGISPLGIEYKRLYNKLDHAPITFDMLKTKDIPNWFNAISSEYIKKFIADNNVKVKFEGDGVVNPKPEGDDIGHLWLETTFYANSDVNYDFQYVAAANSIDLTTCCHTFDITTNYLSSGILMTNMNLREIKFAGSGSDFPGYFQTITKLNSIYNYTNNVVPYNKGIDKITEQTKINYSVKKNFFYLTVSLNYQQFPYPSGLCGFFNPVNFSSRVYDIGFPLNIPSVSATFLQHNNNTTSTSQSYFLFSPWFVYSMASVHGTSISSSGGDYPSFIHGDSSDLLMKSWGDYVIYKQSATDKRTPGKPNVLFAGKNSVITYAIQHKALFTQRCLYVLKFKEVKAGDFIGLKTSHNTQTGNNFNTVIWWSVDGDGKAPTNVTAKEFREVKATKDTTPEQLADMIANDINNKGTTIFHIPNITDDKCDYYIRC